MLVIIFYSKYSAMHQVFMDKYQETFSTCFFFFYEEVRLCSVGCFFYIIFLEVYLSFTKVELPGIIFVT